MDKNNNEKNNNQQKNSNDLNNKFFELEKKLKELEKEKEKYLFGWQKERADFLNYKKDEIQRFEEIIKFSNESLIIKMLPIIESIRLAMKTIPENLKDNEWVKGILMIRDQFNKFLEKEGVEEIKTIGERFNPIFHEAVEMIENKKIEKGKITEEVSKGYLLKGKIIKPAKVKVVK